MTWDLLLVTFGVDFVSPCASRQPAEPIKLENAINATTGYFDVMVALQIPNNADWPEMKGLPKV